MKSFYNNDNLGALKALLSPHVFSDEVNEEISRFPKQTFIGLGQGGGRIAAEFARFGHPTFLMNSSISDMAEHKKLIPDSHRILTTSSNYPELEGTDKNAQLGYQIAVENKEKYKQVALHDDVLNSEFVWLCVSLGGGTGNGALKVALTYLSQVRGKRALPGNKVPLGIICSLPSSEEKGSSFRKNALAGVAEIQRFINDNKIGSVLVIDNEKINDYYANEPLRTYAGTEIDAKSYSNMVVASSLTEISTIPLLHGRSVLDKTELLTTLSTPGWLSISKKMGVNNDDNLEEIIDSLYKENEVLANYNLKKAFTGAISIMYPNNKNISPKIADDVYKYASKLLDTKVNLSITKNNKLESLLLYGLVVLPTPPTRIYQLKEEMDQWVHIEHEQESEKMQVAAGLGLDEFDNFFTTESLNNQSRGSITLADLDDDFDNNQKKKSTENKLLADLEDIEF